MKKISIICDSVFCVGDIHGNFESLLGCIKKYDLVKSALIVCGDCGFGFYKEDYYKQVLSKLNKECIKRDVVVCFVRGNHDDPVYFKTDNYNKSNVILVQDYTVLEFLNEDPQNYKAVLCIGGATSIDRTYRMRQTERNAREYMRYHHGVDYDEAYRRCQQCYWIDEKPVFSKDLLEDLNNNQIKINYVCTHTCPSFCEPIHKKGIEEWIKADPALNDELDEERKVFDDVYEFLKQTGHPLKAWYYGHYHYHKFMSIDEVKFYLLDMERGGNFDIVEML